MHMTIQNLYMNVHNSFTCNNRKLETTQIHNKKFIERQIMYTYTREYYSAIKRNEYSTCGVGLVAKLCLTLVTPMTVACPTPLSMGFSRQQ